MFSKIQKCLVFFVCIVATNPALADRGWLFGGSLGSADISDNFDGFDFDDSSTVYRIYGGYAFNDYFGIQAGYLNLGDFGNTFNIIGTPVTLEFEADGFTFAGQGKVDLGEVFSLRGQIGAFFWDGAASIVNVTSLDPGDTNLLIGVGFSARLSKNFSITADYTNYDLEDTDTDIIFAGFEVNFGR